MWRRRLRAGEGQEGPKGVVGRLAKTRLSIVCVEGKEEEETE
jgi:hypothetical protein